MQGLIFRGKNESEVIAVKLLKGIEFSNKITINNIIYQRFRYSLLSCSSKKNALFLIHL